MVKAIFIIAALVVFLPSEALAWGPAAHLEFSREVLTHLNLLPKNIAGLLNRFPYHFYYGSIAADIVVGKNLVEELLHCHNWGFGFKLLKRAEKDSQKSFAYGYMCHLAADTVAHNHFIPEKTVRSYSSRIRRHAYWELRFDALMDKSVWRIPRHIVKEVHADNDVLLRTNLKQIPMPFETSKKIFSSYLSLHRVDNWHKMMEALSSSSKWVLHVEEKDKYKKFAVDSMIDLLKYEHKAKCVHKDPKGMKNIKKATEAGKRLKKLAKKKHKNKEAFNEEMMKSLREVSIVPSFV